MTESTREETWSFEGTRRHHIRSGLRLTPMERLRWLEETVDEMMYGFLFYFAENSAVTLTVQNVARFSGTAWEDLPDSNDDVGSVSGRQVIVAGGNPYVVRGDRIALRESGDWKDIWVDGLVPNVDFSSIAHVGGEFFLGSDGFSSTANLLRWDGDMVTPTLTPVDRGVVEYLFYEDDGRPVPFSISDSFPSVEQLFDAIQDGIDRNADFIDVEYDFTYGYPTSVYIDYDRRVADEELSITTRGLERWE